MSGISGLKLHTHRRNGGCCCTLLTEGLLAYAHFNHDPLHRSSQDEKEGQEPVDAESLLPGHSLQSSPHLGLEGHDRGLQVGVRAEAGGLVVLKAVQAGPAACRRPGAAPQPGRERGRGS